MQARHYDRNPGANSYLDRVQDGPPIESSPNGFLDLTFGTDEVFLVAGGPYRSRGDEDFGVNMAAELYHLPAMVRVPTKDFNVPLMDQFERGVLRAAVATVLGYPVYVGCMGGIGRTGLMMGGLEKLNQYMGQGFVRRSLGRMPDTQGVILGVRERYLRAALETTEQEEFLTGYDPRKAAQAVRHALRIKGLT